MLGTDTSLRHGPRNFTCFLALGWSICGVAAGDVLFDSLCVTDGPYQAFYNHCGGELYWGVPIDIQMAGYFPISSGYFITMVTADYVSMYDQDPDDVCVSIYPGADECWGVEQDPTASVRCSGGAIAFERFKDAVYGDYGIRIHAELPYPMYLSAANWYLSVQPSGQDTYAQTTTDADYVGCSKSRCDFATRDGGERNTCCKGAGLYGQEEWFNSGNFESHTLSMRVEGVPAGDYGIGGALSAKCKAGRGKVVAKVKGATGAGVLTCWLDATPGPRQDMTITPDGKGKTVFRNVAAGEHTVTVCEQTVSLMCEP